MSIKDNVAVANLVIKWNNLIQAQNNLKGWATAVDQYTTALKDDALYTGTASAAEKTYVDSFKAVVDDAVGILPVNPDATDLLRVNPSDVKS